METIKEKLNNRNITDSTKSVYLKKLQMLQEGLEQKDFNFLKDTDKVITWVNQFKFAKRKSLLNSAMVGLSPASKKDIPDDVKDAYGVYRDLVINMSAEEKETKKEQKKNLKESEKWRTMKDLENIRDHYGKQLKKKGYNQKTTEWKDPADRHLLQKYLVATLYTTQPPRRLEYGNMKRIREEDYFLESQEERESNNYIVVKNKRNKYFSFADVKIPDPDNRIVKIPINKVLNGVINCWFNLTGEGEGWAWVKFLNPCDGVKRKAKTNKCKNGSIKQQSFLQDFNGDPMTSNKLSKYIIQKVFAEHGIGVGMIRHIYLSEKYENDTPLKEKEETAKMMNHSVGTAELIYVKKD